MGTEVLRPQDCLIERIRVPTTSFSRRKNYYGNNPVPNQNYVSNPRPRKQAVRSEPRRIHVQPAAQVSKRTSSEDLSGFKSEKVTILRRGESLDSKMNETAAAKVDMYAGSAFVVSPEPSSLPLPSFSRKKQASRVDIAGGDDSATRDLRRLLRLD